MCVFLRALNNKRTRKKEELIERENKKNQFCFFLFHFHFRQILCSSCDEEVSAMNDPSPDLIEDANIDQQLNRGHLSYRELFRRLKKNSDGRIEVDQLIELLDKVGVETSTKERWIIARVSVVCFC